MNDKKKNNGREPSKPSSSSKPSGSSSSSSKPSKSPKSSGSSKSQSANGRGARRKPKTVRYAVVGLGYISQVAVLPAFVNAKNSELVALVSDDQDKLDELGRRYGVTHRFRYDNYEDCLREVDAVYIALPNSLHREYTVRAAEAGVHVLCEKPMAVHAGECREMIEAAEKHDVRLMIAYRLHFEKANLEVVKAIRDGKIGEPRVFHSVFTQQVKDGDTRLSRELGGGTLYDIGVYCINAARYLFRDEPIEVSAFSAKNGDPRFDEVDEATGAVLRFPGGRLATFTTSFGAAPVAEYRIVGTEGDIRLDQAYEYAEEMTRVLTVKGRSSEKRYQIRDQFGPELVYFSDCILEGRDPEPSGKEGLADVRIVEALYESARSGQPVHMEGFPQVKRPEPSQEITRPAIDKPKLIKAEPPSGKKRSS